MILYGRRVRSHHEFNIEAVQVMLTLLAAGRDCINIPEVALRSVGMFKLFDDFGTHEIEAAITEAKLVNSTIAVLDGFVEADAAAVPTPVVIASYEGEQKKT